MKENRQGCLSRSIKEKSELLTKVRISFQTVEKAFSTVWNPVGVGYSVSLASSFSTAASWALAMSKSATAFISRRWARFLPAALS